MAHDAFRPAAWLLLCGALVAGEAARPEDAYLFTVFDAASAAKPPALAGDRGPAAEVAVSSATVDDRKLARLQVRFKPGLQYAAMELDATTQGKAFADPDLPAEPEAIVIACRASRGAQLVVRIGDGADQFESESAVAEEGWRELRLALPADLRGWKAVARGDGRLNGRIRSLAVGLRAGTAASGTLDLARVALLPAPLDIGFATKAPGNLFLTGERPVGTISAGKAGDGLARIRIEDAFGTVVKELDQVPLNGVDIALPEEFGYYTVRARQLGWRPGAAASYAVIPDNRVPGREPNSPYGINCHYGNYWYKPLAAEIVKRVGIGWIRDGHAAKDSAAEQDHALENASAQGLCYFPHFGWAPQSKEENRKADGGYDFAPVTDQQKAYAKNVAAAVDCYDMLNEPDLHWMRLFGGDRTSGLWIDVYAKWFGPAFQRATAAADPAATVFWEGGLKQAEAYFARAPVGTIGGISPHSYAHKAKPEDHGDLNGGYAAYADFVRKNKLSWPIWIGELGFTTFIGSTEHYIAVSELEQAAQLVRALSLNLAHGAEKVFYYDLVEWTMATWKGDPSNDASNCEFHFGIVRKDYTPKPGIAAYANLIAQTKGCRWLGRVRLKGGDEVHAYAFQRGDERPGMVAWTRSGTAPLALPAGTQVTDLFGRQSAWAGGELTLGEVPVYIAGINPEGIEAIPTYAQLPRLHDATAVQLGPLYGRARPVAQRKARPAPPPAAARPAPAAWTAAPDALAAWDATLLQSVRARLAKRKTPAFRIDALRQVVRVEAVEGDEVSARIGVDALFTCSWRKLTAMDRLRLAQALLADGGDEFDAAGNALVAFHARAAGEEELAQIHLGKSGLEAARVQASFTQAAPAP